MSKLIVLRGIPGSGKSTQALHWVGDAELLKRAVVSRDDIRRTQFKKTKAVLNHEEEQIVSAIQQSTVKTLLDQGYEVVIDDMNLRPKYVREWRRIALAHGAEFSTHETHVDVDEAVRRDSLREGSLGEEVIRGIAARFYPKGKFLPVPDEVEEVAPAKYEANEDLFPAFMFDIDGTSALNEGGRSYYDLTRVGEDSPNTPVINIALALYNQGYTIVFCSGRDESSREATAEWLREHLWDNADKNLIMRKEGDQRRDFIVKSEMFDNEIAPKYNVLGVFDDRPSVLRMWRAKGIPTFAIGDPHVEF